MKILFLTPGCFDKGGISRYSRYQISALRRIYGNNAVRVLSLLGPEPDSFEEQFEVHWYAGSNSKSSQLKFISKTLAQIIGWRPQVVHIAHVNFSGFAHLMAKLCRAKTVLNVYGLEVWSGLSADAKYGLKNTHHLISDCHYTANYVEGEKYRQPGSTTVIWDCVDLQRFSPGPVDEGIVAKYKLFPPKDHFIVMSLGRLSKSAMHKGFDRLISAFSVFSQKNPSARLVIAGKGDYLENYRQMAAAKGIAGKVHFTGMVDDADLPALYRCGTVFSLVSDRGNGRGEGIPLTPLEAMACGVPVIVGNQDGSQEAVDGNHNGYIIDPINQQQHVDVLTELASSTDLLKYKQAAAIQIARERFSFDKFVDKHKKFYSRFE
jgi:phosphatidyl-myo-inositol dimannoside synthase